MPWKETWMVLNVCKIWYGPKAVQICCVDFPMWNDTEVWLFAHCWIVLLAYSSLSSSKEKL